MKLHSYVVARDYGFAPNPFFGICTLATCKPNIRRTGKIEDWVVGITPKKRGTHLVYAMRITQIMTFNQYWSDPRFQKKKPNLCGSKKQAFGDNIYFRNSQSGKWHQEDSHHSFYDGSENQSNIDNDTQTDRVLISEDFVYCGGAGPEIPSKFLNYGSQHVSICVQRNHKSKFPPEFINGFIAWIRSLNQKGYSGEPADWPNTP